jgi:hypothetical protein
MSVAKKIGGWRLARFKQKPGGGQISNCPVPAAQAVERLRLDHPLWPTRRVPIET